jgi:hypothetical protein
MSPAIAVEAVWQVPLLRVGAMTRGRPRRSFR